MDRYCYGNDRWRIVCFGSAAPVRRAAELLYAVLAQHVSYIPVCEQAPLTAQARQDSLILLGLAEEKELAPLLQAGGVPEKGYLVRVAQSPFAAGRQIAVLAGAAAADVLYAAAEFIEDYLPTARRTGTHEPYLRPLFSGRMPLYENRTAPACAVRGIWTWGHCIYNVDAFARQMALMRLNEITIWNDFAPLNLREAVECFHSYGIHVIFGYSWSWGEDVDVRSPEALTQWTQRALEIYERDYAAAGGDGIYTQLFTETNDDMLCGVPIADAVTQWVNTIGKRLLARYPGLRIQFGLHATSVKKRLHVLHAVDPSIEIIWEDCGAFPYTYLPECRGSDAETDAFTEKLCTLRPGCGCGVVLKGQLCLDWTRFEHQKGPYLMGCRSAASFSAREREVSELWHYVQSRWMENGTVCQHTIAQLARHHAQVYALVEDGLLEAGAWLPVALYAQMLWAPEEPFPALLRRTAARTDVRMA